MAIIGKGSFLLILECTNCSKKYDPENIHRLCTCGKVLFSKYDLEQAKETINPKDMKKRSFDLWRFFEIMPVRNPDFRFTLGEGWTPLIQLKNIGNTQGMSNIFLKDESQNPTGTFKSRGLCAAVSRGVELGIKDFVIPTAGNAGAALAAYAACANVAAHIFMPEDTPQLIQKEVRVIGADIKKVSGLISDAAREANKAAKENLWFDVSTLKEPYRVEGKKTMGFELVEQFDWTIPDVIIYGTGGGTGLVGMWKAFDELETIGIIGSERPRMISVQSSGCAPIVKAFNENRNKADLWESAQTIASGLRVPAAIGDYLILQTIRESKGTAITVHDKEIISAMKLFAKKEGVLLAPEAAATYSALENLNDTGLIDRDEVTVLFGTGSGLLYSELW